MARRWLPFELRPQRPCCTTRPSVASKKRRPHNPLLDFERLGLVGAMFWPLLGVARPRLDSKRILRFSRRAGPGPLLCPGDNKVLTYKFNLMPPPLPLPAGGPQRPVGGSRLSSGPSVLDVKVDSPWLSCIGVDCRCRCCCCCPWCRWSFVDAAFVLSSAATQWLPP